MPAWREPASPGTTDSLVSPEPSSAVLFASGQPGSDARTGNQTSECCMRGAWSALMQATKQPLRARLVSFSTQPVSHLPSRLTVARFVRCNGLQFGCWIHRAMCDKEIVWFAAVLHRFSLVDVGAYVQVHAASLAREIRRKWSYLRMQAGTLLLHRVSQVLQVHQPNNSSFSHKERGPG